MGKKEINSFFTGFNGHKFSAFAKISGGSKKIFAAKVAVMGNMKAHGFDRCAFHHISKAFVIIFAEKLTCFLKFKKFSVNFDKFLLGIFFRKFFKNIFREFFRKLVLELIKKIKTQFIKNVNRS